MARQLDSVRQVSQSVGVSILHVCPKPELLGKLQTAERINKTVVVRAGVGVSQSLIIFLQATPCQVDCLCVHLLCRRLECRTFLSVLCSHVCLCDKILLRHMFYQDCSEVYTARQNKVGQGLLTQLHQALKH